MASRPWTPAAFSRGDRSPFGRWFWTIDKGLLLLVIALMVVGIIAVAAASPAAARRLSGTNFRYDDLYFFKRQIVWVLIGAPLMLGVSMLSVGNAKRLALVGTLGALVLMAVVPFMGGDANGAARWIELPGFKLQPSEFFKPCFIVTTAWLLSFRFEDRTLPVLQLSFMTLCLGGGLLVLQPDFGQTVLIAMVWLVQAMLAGMSMQIVGILAAIGVAGLGLAYLTFDHFALRIDKFLTGGGDTYQIDRALDCFRSGGLLGTGPGDGTRKFRLPEAQTDYIFSVIGEEFGMIACLMVAGLFIGIVVRAFLLALDEDDPFVFLAASGLATQFGAQASINMMVNLKLLPSKGMTLPFISHGGSSFLACALGMGLLMAFTRRNPFLKSSPYVERWRAG
ncbi:putative peptidoglycan glycosyltransferase FtsW [Sandarakinorhabdus sp.]|uniref:FtsW/RodA/SpoVE family cell cycle protein n=1 Tax=Sandarakinorhabdus sp. TaxID=1916663 RepID=UPI00286D9E16|nr:putative peptidoglycan glycosyltransferase FtsW [Sandarakinorhabdus sp.]